MQVGEPIPVEVLLAHLDPLHDDQLLLALQTYQVSVDTLQQLKAYSAQFYLTEPERALQIAQTAYRLSQH